MMRRKHRRLRNLFDFQVIAIGDSGDDAIY